MSLITASRAAVRAVAIFALAANTACPLARAQTKYNYLQFGYGPEKQNWDQAETTLSPSNVGGIKLLYSVSLPASCDSVPLVLTNAATIAGTGDVIIVGCEHGQLLCLSAQSGAKIWEHDFTSGGFRYSTSAPAIDPNLQYVYFYGLEGKIHKLNIADGSEVTGGGWPEESAENPGGQKGSGDIAIATDSSTGTSYLYHTVSFAGSNTCGHITAVNLSTGAQNVWNFANSSLKGHQPSGPGGCVAWNRASAVYDPDTNFVYSDTDNTVGFSPANHKWSETLSALRPDGTSSAANSYPMDSFTPTNVATLCSSDLDMISNLLILPAIAGSSFPHVGITSGKSATLWVLNIDNLSGQGGAGHTGGQLFSEAMPQGMGQLGVMGQGATWVNPADGSVWVYYGSDAGISGMKAVATSGGGVTLQTQWILHTSPVQSPVAANGVVYYVNGGSQSGATSTVFAVNATTGAQLWSGGIDHHHWSSPIVANGVIYMCDGQSADQGSGNTGTLKAWGFTTPPPPPPNPPTNLAATAVSPTQVDLSWTASTSTGVTYTIFRSTDSSFTPSSSTQVATGLSGTNYSDTGLAAGTPYYYLAEADASGGDSVPSNEATATTQSAGPPPGPPSNLGVTAVFTTQIDLSWTASTTAGATYDVFRSTTSGFAPSSSNQVASGINSTSYSDTGLAPGTTYFYLAEASLSGANSSPSNQASAATLSQIVLDANTMSPTGSGQTITDNNDANATDGVWVLLEGTGAGQYLQFTTPSIPVGTYDVDMRYKANTNRAQVGLSIDGTQVGGSIDQYGATVGFVSATAGSVTFSAAGTHTIRLATTGQNSSSSGFYVSADAFTLNQEASQSNQVSAPMFGPMGGTYTSTQSVTISTTTGGASINYTTDGSTPTPTHGTAYTAPVRISQTTMLQAIAFEGGMTDSPVASASYTIDATTLAASGLSPTGSGPPITDNDDPNATGGVWVLFEGSGTAQFASFTTPSVLAGTYQLQFRYKANTQRAQHTVAVDGAQVGGTVDQYSATIGFTTVTLGNLTFATDGTHTIQLAITGKNSASSGYYVSADSFTLVPQ